MSASLVLEPKTETTLDPDSRRWVDDLRAEGEVRERALADLHRLLLKAARFEVHRRRAQLPHLRGDDFDDLAQQAADDALVALLPKLETFRGESRFTTWAYKFALYEAAAKLRRRLWQGRELPLEDEAWAILSHGGPSPEEKAEVGTLLEEIGHAIRTDLTLHQREVLLALAVHELPIDVLAERMNTTRGALYKTLHDARKKLRARLEESGWR